MPKIVILWSDVVVIATLLLLLLYAFRVRASKNLRATWAQVGRDPAALCSAVVLVLFFAVAVVDSLHFRRALADVPAAGAQQRQAYATRTESLLDVLLARQLAGRETSYSAPLAMRAFTKDSVEVAGATERIYPRLLYGGKSLRDDAEWAADLLQRTALGLGLGLVLALVIAAAVAFALARVRAERFSSAWRALARNQTDLPLRAALFTVLALCLVFGPLFALAQNYHVFGSDRTGNDVFYQALKSIRTAFVIGTLSTIATLPLAVGLGILAGYLRGWVDEVVQYLYTLLSSIPNVLLIAACVLMMQVFIDTHPDLFETGAERADVRLFLLCVILGYRLGHAVPAAARRDHETLRARLRAGRERLRCAHRPDHGPPHLSECGAPDHHHDGARFFGADSLRSGAVVCGCWRRPVDEQLWRHDQPGAHRDEPRPAGVVVIRRGVQLHGCARARGQPFCRRRE